MRLSQNLYHANVKYELLIGGCSTNSFQSLFRHISLTLASYQTCGFQMCAEELPVGLSGRWFTYQSQHHLRNSWKCKF